MNTKYDATSCLTRTTELLVSADLEIWLKDSNEKQEIRVHFIPCTWKWDESTRQAAETWAVHDWVATALGDNIETYWIQCVVGSPVKPHLKVIENQE